MTTTYRAGVGRLVVDRYDFQKHIEGTDFRHQALGIDLDEALDALGGALDAQTAFTNINTYINSQTGIGQGFITIGDGYDTWHAADGSQNFDPLIPALNIVLQPIFDDLIAGNPVSSGYVRIQHGGIIVIKAGTYILTDTLEVPPGITLMGEGWGTKIINAIALDIDTSEGGPAPIVDELLTKKPMFRIKYDPNRSFNDAAVEASMFVFGKKTTICNMVISDNFVEPTRLGDVFYKLAQNSSGDNPLISQEAGSHLVLNNLVMLGRVAFSLGKEVSSATRFAVQLDTSTALSTGTFLEITDCFIDGFSQPIDFQALGGSKDSLEINNSKIRSHGYLDADGTTPAANCIANIIACNVRMVSNHFYGNHINAGTVLYIDDVIGGAVNLQSKSKIIVASNEIVVDKESIGTPVHYAIYVNPSNLTTFYTKAVAQSYGNVFQEVDGFKIDSALSLRVYSISASYVMDTHGGDFAVLVDTSSSEITVTLPGHSAGRKVIIKDSTGYASVNNITLARSGSTGSIDGYAGNRKIATNFASWTLLSDGTNWYIV